MYFKKWKTKLWQELPLWVHEGLIAPEQEERIKRRYAAPASQNQFIATLVLLGSLLFGLGILLFIASNWVYLDKTIKVSFICAVIIACNTAGYIFHHRKNAYPRIGEGLLLLGAFSFGAGIWLIAQIFQLPIHYANAILFWFIGIIPVIYVFRSQTILILAALLVPAWFITVTVLDPSHIVYAFFIPMSIILYLTYWKQSAASLVISIVSLSLFLMHCIYVLREQQQTAQFSDISVLYINLLIAYGCFVYIIGILHRCYQGNTPFTSIYRICGMLFILINTYFLTISPSSHHTLQPVLHPAAYGLVIYALYSISIILAVCTMVIRHAAYCLEHRTESMIIIFFIILQLLCMTNTSLNGLWIVLFYNLILFAQISAFLYLGYLFRQESIFRLALIMFFIDVITRYCDTFWRIFSRSIFFFIGGLLLITSGLYLDYKRKNIEKKIKEKRLAEQNKPL